MLYIDLFPAPDVKPAPLSQETALLPGAKRLPYAPIIAKYPSQFLPIKCIADLFAFDGELYG